MIWLAIDGHPAERITITRGDKTVGELTKLSLRKTVEKSKHFMVKHEGWAVDAQALKVAEAFGCKLVLIKDREEGKLYRASIDKFFSAGQSINYGYGNQIVLAEKHWTVSKGDR